MQDARVSTIVRVSLKSIGAEIQASHAIPQEFSTASIEGGDLVMRFGDVESPAGRRDPVLTDGSAKSNRGTPPRRRRHSSRNRMKTRGWNVITKMLNSKGQMVTIYEPFVQALRGVKTPKSEQRKRVIDVLRANGNRPGPVSIDYYLSNTLEYLQKEPEQ